MNIDAEKTFNQIVEAMSHAKTMGSNEERRARRIAINLIQKNPELAVMAIGKDESTLLVLAARFDDVEILQLLLDQGRSDPRAVDNDQYSALVFAAGANDEGLSMKMIKALTPHCKPQSWNPRSNDGCTDVGVAISKGHAEVADFLAKARGVPAEDDPLERDCYGWTWLDLALQERESCREKIVRWVLSLPQGKRMLRDKDDAGLSTLERAKNNGLENMVALMMAQEAIWEREELVQAIDGPSRDKARTGLRL